VPLDLTLERVGDATSPPLDEAADLALGLPHAGLTERRAGAGEERGTARLGAIAGSDKPVELGRSDGHEELLETVNPDVSRCVALQRNHCRPPRNMVRCNIAMR
jgi:hypothetical protein